MFVIFYMKYLNSEYYAEVKDHRYKIHPTENIILRKRNPPNSLRIQYQIQNETQIRRNQKVIKKTNDELVAKIYPKNKNQPFQQQSKFKPLKCSSCKRINWLEFDKGFFVEIVSVLLIKRNIKLIKKYLDKIIIFQLDYLMLIRR